jgi:tetratricopeptide (TPR) repeat protein
MRMKYLMIKYTPVFLFFVCFSLLERAAFPAEDECSRMHDIVSILYDEAIDEIARGDMKNYYQKLGKARSTCAEALNGCENSYDLLMQSASIYFRLNDLDMAIESAKKALAIRPNDASANNLLGKAYLVLGKEDDGISYLEKSVSTKDVPSGYLYGYCGELVTAGRNERAIDICTEAIKTESFFGKVLGQLYHLRAIAYRRKGLVDEAREDFKNARLVGYNVSDLGFEEVK